MVSMNIMIQVGINAEHVMIMHFQSIYKISDAVIVDMRTRMMRMNWRLGAQLKEKDMNFYVKIGIK